MSTLAIPVALVLALLAGPAHAQPKDDAAQDKRALASYAYLMDRAGNRVLVSTKYWRNDPKYDDRTFHRFLDVLSALEKKGFGQDEKAVIDTWSGTKPYARCFVYLEDIQAGRPVKGAGPTTGSRVWCSESGISEQELKASDTPKHVDEVMKRFDTFLDLAKQNVKK
ncbi:MAG TPA: hypothetical protein VNG69_17205 [Casimicrobiaceae bacterium]|nr:hypothetical protein [Casimicrobiaceae bacterium]